MSSEERLAARRKAASDARNVAVQRLKAAHPEEYRSLYNEEAEKRGITPRGTRRERKRQRLLRELAALDADSVD